MFYYILKIEEIPGESEIKVIDHKGHKHENGIEITDFSGSQALSYSLDYGPMAQEIFSSSITVQLPYERSISVLLQHMVSGTAISEATIYCLSNAASETAQNTAFLSLKMTTVMVDSVGLSLEEDNSCATVVFTYKKIEHQYKVKYKSVKDEPEKYYSGQVDFENPNINRIY